MKQHHPAHALVPSLALIFALIVTAGCAQTQSTRDDPPAENETEQVSIGYGQVDQANVTGSVAVMTRSEVDQRKVTDLAELLEGRVAGVRVVRTAAGAKIRIRGIHTLMGSQDPLFVLDGTPLAPDPSGSVRFLNPSDIERVEVLKGAAAAMYGSRAANGVILITTKRGR